ncbi:MAG TPA: hypothetical protein VHL31_04105 [Geminicoccus sp.]|jgi:cytochrome c oxidase subunit 4|uniref:hypothetical protein n=1 Tax=Geminicoccus sp. TaxID=2024832 RepID=UPI002E33C2AE|nr:hypothetical protein [Geminicoccus sp.]HEX2525474.1 hypothetical protein [Geminicoccus sp.]
MAELRPLILVWSGLLVLLALTVAGSFVLIGPLGFMFSIAVALAKAGLIFWFYMHQNKAGGIVRLAAVDAAVWLLILILLVSTDYVTRSMF